MILTRKDVLGLEDMSAEEILGVLDIAGQRVPSEWSRYASGIHVSTTADAGAYVVAGLLKGTVAWRFPILIN